MGLQRYIDEQLHPERIADTAAAGTAGGADHDRPELARDRGALRAPAARGAPRAQAGRQGRRAERKSGPGRRGRKCRAAGPDPAASEQRHRRALRTEAVARRLQRAAAAGSPHRFLVQPLQRRRAQGSRSLSAHRVRARDDPASRARQVPRPARRDRQESRDAVLSRQLDERRSQRPATRDRTAVGAHRPRPVRRTRLHATGAASTGAGEKRPERSQRKLRPRADGAAHARVDGGYTQKDVTEVARALTGWSIDNPRQGGGFRFQPRIHDEGEKVVLGHVIKAGGGESDGEQVLDILATHPSTARFIRDQARATVRRRHAAAGARRSRGGAVPSDRRRSARGDADDPDLAGIPVAAGRTAPR